MIAGLFLATFSGAGVATAAPSAPVAASAPTVVAASVATSATAVTNVASATPVLVPMATGGHPMYMTDQEYVMSCDLRGVSCYKQKHVYSWGAIYKICKNKYCTNFAKTKS